jgi:hypothetical protein
MTFADTLDDAMYSRRKLIVETMSRGTIIGTPYCVDEFVADPERLGYCLLIGKHEQETVFLDEIIGIEGVQSEILQAKAV